MANEKKNAKPKKKKNTQEKSPQPDETKQTFFIYFQQLACA